MLLTVFVVCLFVWLFIKAFGLVLRLAWGVGKLLFGGLLILAVPGLILAAVFAGGLLLLIPLAVVAAIFAILKLAF